ncbi:hypothetical protein GOV14_01420 [Candidatus Pacearchaeota archaeon]|nr:hypothetical protein [Candidatus Pacearchaeota archaeon]
MKSKLRKKIDRTINNSFNQLIFIYAILVLFVSISLMHKFSYLFHILAIILGVSGFFIIRRESIKYVYLNKRLYALLFVLALVIIFALRIIPYTNNSVPFSYDYGIYKYGIESFAKNGFKVVSWVKLTFSPAFLSLTKILSFFVSSKTILIDFFILINLIFGLSIYLVVRQHFGKVAALISFILYAASIIQYKAFTFLYYNSIIALTFLLLSVYFFKRKKRFLFILFFALTGAFHLPTFFVYFLSYIALVTFIFINGKKHQKSEIKKELLDLLYIFVLTVIFYLGFFSTGIKPLINPSLSTFSNEPGSSFGSFVSFFQYSYSTLFYLPFAILGFFYVTKRKNFNLLFFMTIISFILVYTQLFFYKRFIIHLDLMFIILSSLGFLFVIRRSKVLGTFIMIAMIGSSMFVTYDFAKNLESPVTPEEFNLIKKFSLTEENAFVMTTSSKYAPYLLSYSNRKTIAPGLFGDDHTKSDWQDFLNSKDLTEIKQFLDSYRKHPQTNQNYPLYIFLSRSQNDNLKPFLTGSDACFEVFNSHRLGHKIYEYVC